MNNNNSEFRNNINSSKKFRVIVSANKVNLSSNVMQSNFKSVERKLTRNEMENCSRKRNPALDKALLLLQIDSALDSRDKESFIRLSNELKGEVVQ